jgi:hypothetical protein
VVGPAASCVVIVVTEGRWPGLGDVGDLETGYGPVFCGAAAAGALGGFATYSLVVACVSDKMKCENN